MEPHSATGVFEIRNPSGGGGSSSSTRSSGGSVSKAEAAEEVSSSPEESGDLDLGLGLSIGARKREPRGRMLTPRVPPSSSRSSSSSSSSSLTGRGNQGFAGSKRSADSVEAANNAFGNQVVGWPPVRAYRMNSLSKQAKLPAFETNSKPWGNGSVETLFVKVNMDGIPIGRKIDLTAHTCYEALAQALGDMFDGPAMTFNAIREDGLISKAPRPLNLLDGSSEYVLTYEDKDGDLMLVGDVPWRMFLHSVRRLRIMRRSEADGLGARTV